MRRADAAPDQLTLRVYGASPGSHSHGHFQALVGLEGVLELEIEGRGQRLGPGDAMLVAPGERHDFASATGSHCLVLDTAQDPWARCAAAPAYPQQVKALAAYLAQSLRSRQPLAALHGPALLLEAWKPEATATRARRAIDWTGLASWVQQHLHQPLTVTQLAGRVFLSPSQFAARCHEAQGASPLDWLRAQRLARARALRDAGVPVAEVARRTGYRSPSALTAAMRRAGLLH
jgi:AraC-like DNA-binding protein